MKIITCKNNYGRTVELPIEKFKPRPSVYAVFKKEDRILVCKTKSNGKLWLPGGGVEAGETHEEALRREVMEETGIKDMKFGRLISDFRNYCYYEPLDDACDAHLFFYECETGEEKVKPNEEIEDGEATDFSWMKIDQILEEGFCDADEKIREMLVYFCSENN